MDTNGFFQFQIISEILVQYWFDVGPPFATLVQYYISMKSILLLCWNCTMWNITKRSPDFQRQNAVSTFFTSEQILPFGIEEQIWNTKLQYFK